MADYYGHSFNKLDFYSLNDKMYINGKEVEYHHSAYTKGYCPVDWSSQVGEEYNGKFGKGYKVYENNKNSTQYMIVYYYILKDEK